MSDTNPLPADPCDAFLTFLWEEITARDWGDEARRLAGEGGGK